MATGINTWIRRMSASGPVFLLLGAVLILPALTTLLFHPFTEQAVARVMKVEDSCLTFYSFEVDGLTYTSTSSEKTGPLFQRTCSYVPGDEIYVYYRSTRPDENTLTRTSYQSLEVSGSLGIILIGVGLLNMKTGRWQSRKAKKRKRRWRNTR